MRRACVGDRCSSGCGGSSRTDDGLGSSPVARCPQPPPSPPVTRSRLRPHPPLAARPGHGSSPLPTSHLLCSPREREGGQRRSFYLFFLTVSPRRLKTASNQVRVVIYPV
uniref:Uncharacterized protein n=1 Tax=Oryza sativa subsp. japonica TaxID=39947 RepID=Q8LHW6_ORYSJ|nr:hypothetical protein [Oryza sativa Japonica Group]BAD30951.1 hypothetical protein [Oryza sativa Japonica Group]